MGIKERVAAIAGLALAATACQGESDKQQVLEDELRAAQICRVPVTVDERRSLYVTDEAILATGGQDFTLLATLNQLAAQVGDPTLTGLDLFEQWWDTQNLAPGFGNGPHCEDPFNGFSNQCPRSEGAQANPAVSAAELASYTPIAVVNRFDLAPADGSNCGEYRIVYGKTSLSTRNLPIFEAKLPNPNPECGIQACRPIQDMWASLTNINDTDERARRLHEFFYDGIAGFAPVVHIRHYAGASGDVYGGGASGQIRTNQFIQGPWNLREFRLEHHTRLLPPTLTFIPETVKTNPAAVLFNGDLPGSPHPLAETAAAFQRHFLTQVDSLAINDLNRFTYSVPDQFNPGDSQIFGPTSSDYVAEFNADGGGSPFRTRLAALALDHGLTADDIVNRAMANSCAGCHQESVGRSMGGGLTWPGTLGFVHGSEFSTETGPDGPRFIISNALTGTFLPHRRQVMETFLRRSRCIACAKPIDIDGVVARPPVDADVIADGDVREDGAPIDVGAPKTSDSAETIGGRRVH